MQHELKGIRLSMVRKKVQKVNRQNINGHHQGMANDNKREMEFITIAKIMILENQA